MSLSPLSLSSPETMAFTGLVALGLSAIVRKLLPRNAPVPAAVMAPAMAPLPAVPAALPGVPAHVAPLPVLPALPPVVNYVMAITLFNNLFSRVIGTVLTPFYDHGISDIGQRIVAAPTLRNAPPFVATGWEQGALGMLNRLRRSIILHGNRLRGLPTFNVAESALFAERRLLQKMMQVIAPRNARFVGRGAVPMVSFHFCGFTLHGLSVARRTNHVSFPGIECEGFRADVAWGLYYFLIAKAFLLRNGATLNQANYIACCAMLEAVGVAYGQAPRVGWGITPVDLGFVVPATLPVY